MKIYARESLNQVLNKESDTKRFESVNARVWMPDGHECVCKWVNSDPKCKQSLLTLLPFAVLTEQMTTHLEPGSDFDPYTIFLHL